MSSTSPSCWQVLGLISDTATEVDVRRAYANLLRENQGNPDLAKLQHLKKAYNEALLELGIEEPGQTTKDRLPQQRAPKPSLEMGGTSYPLTRQRPLKTPDSSVAPVPIPRRKFGAVPGLNQALKEVPVRPQSTEEESKQKDSPSRSITPAGEERTRLFRSPAEPTSDKPKARLMAGHQPGRVPAQAPKPNLVLRWLLIGGGSLLLLLGMAIGVIYIQAKNQPVSSVAEAHDAVPTDRTAQEVQERRDQELRQAAQSVLSKLSGQTELFAQFLKSDAKTQSEILTGQQQLQTGTQRHRDFLQAVMISPDVPNEAKLRALTATERWFNPTEQVAIIAPLVVQGNTITPELAKHLIQLYNYKAGELTEDQRKMLKPFAAQQQSVK